MQYPLSKHIWYRARQPTKSVSCQSQTENHISHPSVTTNQSKQIHSSSNQSVASADQNTNQPSPHSREVTLVTQKTTCVQKKADTDTNSLPVNFKNSHSSLNIRLNDEIPQTLRPKDSTQIKKRIKEFSSEQINIQYSYTLPKGRVAIHTETEKDTETLEKEIISWQLLLKTSHSNRLYKSCHKQILLSQPKILNSGQEIQSKFKD